MVHGHFQTRGCYEIDILGGKFRVRSLHLHTLVIVLGQTDELKSSLEVKHVEVSDGDSAEAIDPAWVQIDSPREPIDGALIHLETAVTYGKTVDQFVLARVKPQALFEVIHCCLDLAFLHLYQAPLLPKVAIHIVDESV